MLVPLPHDDGSDPLPVPGSPGARFAIAQPVTKKKLAEPMACAHKVPARIISSTEQIPDRLLAPLGHHDRREHAGAGQLGELSRIAPVGLDPIAWFTRCQ